MTEGQLKWAIAKEIRAIDDLVAPGNSPEAVPMKKKSPQKKASSQRSIQKKRAQKLAQKKSMTQEKLLVSDIRPIQTQQVLQDCEQESDSQEVVEEISKNSYDRCIDKE